MNKSGFTTSILGALFVIFILNFIKWIFFQEDSMGAMILESIGASGMPIIQFLCYAIFFFTLAKLVQLKEDVAFEATAFNDRFLPTTPEMVISKDDALQIKRNVLVQEKKDNLQFFMRDLIKKVVNQYRNNESTVEAQGILDSTIKTAKEKMNSKLEYVRFVLGGLSMLGMVGTLAGLSFAMSKADGMLSQNPLLREETLEIIVADFSMAYGTTLVAIVLGFILAYKYHQLLSLIDSFYSDVESNITENLILRVYKSAA